MRIFETHIFGALFAILLALTPVEAANLFTLHVGIDRYKSPEVLPLKGAVNDAEDIYQVVRKFSPKQSEILLNENASRRQIVETIDNYIDQANPGDTIFFSFSGHGAREERDDREFEYLVLSALTPEDKTELILDTELRSFYDRASDKGITFVMLADNCFAGGLTRSIFTSQSVRYRWTEIPVRVDADLSRPTLKDGDIPENLAFFGGDDARTKVPEVIIAGKHRGAMSYLFARAMEGQGDTNGDGIISAKEIELLLEQNVPHYTAQRQDAQIAIGDNVSSLFSTKLPEKPANFQLESVRLKLIGANITANTFKNVKLVEDTEVADLVWDRQSNQIFNGFGDEIAISRDLVAGEIEAVEQLEPIILKSQLLKAINQAALSGVITVELEPDQSEFYCEGGLTKPTFVVSNRRQPFVTIVNLTGHGTLQYLYPDPNFADPPSVLPLQKQPLEMDQLEVKPPFGADHLIVLTSNHDPIRLKSELRTYDGERLDDAFVRMFLDEVSAQSMEVGYKGLFTLPGNSVECKN